MLQEITLTTGDVFTYCRTTSFLISQCIVMSQFIVMRILPASAPQPCKLCVALERVYLDYSQNSIQKEATLKYQINMLQKSALLSPILGPKLTQLAKQQEYNH